MKLQYLTFMIRDMKKSLTFYQEAAGLQVYRRFNPGKGEIAFLANAEGETMLELIQFDDAEKIVTKGMVVSFLVNDHIDALRSKLITLGYSPSEIITEGSKPDHFTVCDPDGILVEFSC